VLGADGSFETGRVTQRIVTIPYVASEKSYGAAKWPTPKPTDPACPENSMDLDFLVGIRIDVTHGRDWGAKLTKFRMWSRQNRSTGMSAFRLGQRIPGFEETGSSCASGA